MREKCFPEKNISTTPFAADNMRAKTRFSVVTQTFHFPVFTSCSAIKKKLKKRKRTPTSLKHVKFHNYKNHLVGKVSHVTEEAK